MKAKFDLPQPGNWILFEELCLKVWGVIWGVSDRIDYNSTNNQGQNGVDIICIPKGQTGYFGIQCKSKRLKLKNGGINKLTKAVIDAEINKAKEFTPPLKHLVIATSLYRDKDIETYVRVLSAANIERGLFSIQIAFWDFIADRIQDNPALNEWYLGGRGLQGSYAVDVTFGDNEKVKTFHPKYIREKHRFLPIDGPEYQDELLEFSKSWEETKRHLEASRSFSEKVRDKFANLFQKKYDGSTVVSLIINGAPAEEIFPKKSIRNFEDRRIGYEFKPSCVFQLEVKNTGQKVIEDFKLKFTVDGEFDGFDIVGPTITQGIRGNYQRHSFTLSDTGGLFQPQENLIVQNDCLTSYKFLVMPEIENPSQILLNWELISRDFYDKGTLLLEIIPEYTEVEKIWYIRSDDVPFERTEYHYPWINGAAPLNI